MRRSTDGKVWSESVGAGLPMPDGFHAWHIDVEWIPDRGVYWAIIPRENRRQSCDDGDLHRLKPRRNRVAHRPVADLHSGGDPRASAHRITVGIRLRRPRSAVVTTWYAGVKCDGERHLATCGAAALPT